MMESRSGSEASKTSALVHHRKWVRNRFSIFFDENGQYRGADAGLYADSIVNEALGNKGEQAKSLTAADTMLVINLWMFLAL